MIVIIPTLAFHSYLKENQRICLIIFVKMNKLKNVNMHLKSIDKFIMDLLFVYSLNILLNLLKNY